MPDLLTLAESIIELLKAAGTPLTDELIAQRLGLPLADVTQAASGLEHEGRLSRSYGRHPTPWNLLPGHS